MDKAPETIPQHIAIIMDGNGRWATRRGLPRTAGHRRGVEAVRTTVRAAADLGVQYLTFFGFSSENWSRPLGEVKELMNILRFYLRSETAELHRNNVQLRIIGNREDLDPDIVELIENAEELTRDNDKITVLIALNYGGRDEIIRAVQKVVQQSIDHPDAGTDLLGIEANFIENLMTADIPDPDLLIRTSGEQRVSNFLLWQCAYTEFVFTDILWPDFNAKALQSCIDQFNKRDRRFGAIDSAEV